MKVFVNVIFVVVLNIEVFIVLLKFVDIIVFFV